MPCRSKAATPDIQPGRIASQNASLVCFDWLFGPLNRQEKMAVPALCRDPYTRTGHPMPKNAAAGRSTNWQFTAQSTNWQFTAQSTNWQ